MKLEDSVMKVKGVGPKMFEKLGKLNIKTVEDLINFFPRKYQDWSKITPMEDIVIGEECLIYGKIVKIDERILRRGMRLLSVILTDNINSVTLTYFNQSWKKKQFNINEEILAYGKVEYLYGKYQISNAEIEAVPKENLKNFEKLVPIYPLTEGITATQMRSMIAFALKNVSNLKENLPIEILIRENFPDKLLAIKTLHNPKNYKEKETARKRLAFEELFFMQAGILMLKEKRKINSYGIKCGPSGKLVKSVLNKFPFELTKDQKKAFSDIENDMEDIEPMYRLLQGDVGSGKTAIAALTAAKIVENGYQATIMAPTEVLASQHYKTFLNLYKNLSVEIAYLSGNIKNSEREVLLNKLKSGEIDILIGTHALIENNVKFAHLGLVITDEQHRFGVKQRELLETKGENPHVLVMTATPIPRTMALSVYGDLDASVINQMPIGRKPVKTYVINDKLLQRVLIFIKKEIQKGHQAYIVCPLVEESEKTDLAAAISVYDKLRKNIFSEYKCGLIYGKMKNSEKEQIMNDFCENKLQILVATSVIEVGVNVPNATVMLVYGAERFGLSQLHQLRGRVGRGKIQSYCILYTKNTNETTTLRLNIMTKINNGFLLSEKDLMLRGSGELFGYHQHGMPDLKVANIIKDLPLLKKARNYAQKFIHSEKNIKSEVKKRFGKVFLERLYH